MNTFTKKRTSGAFNSSVFKEGLKVGALVTLATALIGCSDSDDDEPNLAPVAVDETFTTQADIAFGGALTAVDPNGDAVSFALDQNGTLGSVDIAANGNFTYTPNAQVTGSDSFTFSVSDGEASSTGTIMITIEAQQLSVTSYTREAFAQAPTDSPLPVNGREFTQDADEASFDDLIGQ
jgi:VCBS repeat-containing protein